MSAAPPPAYADAQADAQADANAVVRAAAQALAGARRLVVFTGAGMSADSGIATFRDALSGLWERFDAERLATPEGFEADPPLVWGWYEWRRQQVMLARPNAGHAAVARRAQQQRGLVVITQNVDDLHERAAAEAAAQAAGDGAAGSGDHSPAPVIHLHGSLFTPRCHHCGQPHALPPGLPGEPAGGRRLAPPACTACGGPVRPGVIWFGEALPRRAWAAAEAAVRDSDALLVVGTSGVVYPAAGLPALALSMGRPVWVVNPDPAEPGAHPRLTHLRGRAATLLPALLPDRLHDRQPDQPPAG